MPMAPMAATKGYSLNPRASEAATAARTRNRRRAVTTVQPPHDNAEAIDRSDGFLRLFAFAQHFDAEIARTTLSIFRPAVQLTLDGLYFFIAGMVLGLLVSGLLSLPFRLFRRRRHGYF